MIATFGDLVRVPGSESSLENERAKGADVRVVYSPADALALARANPGLTLVFLAVGFETTAPGVALTVLSAQKEKLSNYTILCAHKTMPQAMEALVVGGEVHVDGFMCPGHVSVVIGASAFSFLADKHGIPCVVTGFEDVDILRGVLMLIAQLHEGRSEVEIEYERAVAREGNRAAQAVMAEVFEPCDAEWRGLGLIPASGLALRPAFSEQDAAETAWSVSVATGRGARGCRCGDVLRAAIIPPDCALFNRVCTPATPQGPCMVSSEGACAAYARYGVGGKVVPPNVHASTAPA